jgi:hypothetical protein
MVGSIVTSKTDKTVYAIIATTESNEFVLDPVEFGTKIAVPFSDLDRQFKVSTVAEKREAASGGWEALAQQHHVKLSMRSDRGIVPPTPEEQFRASAGETSAEAIVASPSLRWGLFNGRLDVAPNVAERVRKLIEAEGR